jgi:hypothetical protein
VKIDGLSDELNESTLVKEAPDLAAIVKSALMYQSQVGNSIRIPGEGASDADKTAFKAKLQQVGMVPRETFHEFVRPEKPEAYELKAPPAGAETVVTQDEVNGWKKWAHEQGLAPNQFESFAKGQIEARLASKAAEQERFGKVDSIVKAKYGDAGLASAKDRALAAAKKFGGQALVDQLAANPSAETIIALAEVGKLFQERGMGDLTPALKFIETPEEASIKISEIRRNPDHAFNKPTSELGMGEVGRKTKNAALEEMMRLRRIAEGKAPLAPGKDFLFEEAS